MLPIIDTPTIGFIVRGTMESSIEEIIIIESSNKNAIGLFR